jgi:hypothetical protein
VLTLPVWIRDPQRFRLFCCKKFQASRNQNKLKKGKGLGCFFFQNPECFRTCIRLDVFLAYELILRELVLKHFNGAVAATRWGSDGSVSDLMFNFDISVFLKMLENNLPGIVTATGNAQGCTPI